MRKLVIITTLACRFLLANPACDKVIIDVFRFGGEQDPRKMKLVGEGRFELFNVTHENVSYERSNRGIKSLTDFGMHPVAYPQHLFEKSAVEGKKILDLGTGDGHFVEDLRELGADAHGVDLIIKDAMKEKGYFHEGDVRQLPNQDASVDQVYSSWSLLSKFYGDKQTGTELISDTILEARRVLKPGGVLRILDPDRRIANIAIKQGGWKEIKVQMAQYNALTRQYEFEPGYLNRIPASSKTRIPAYIELVRE